MAITRYAVLVFCTAAALGLNGCALYSETRDKQAQAAKQAWQQVSLAGQIAVPRKNLSVLLEQQLQLEDALQGARRLALARSMATGTVQETLIKPVDNGLIQLVYSPDAADEAARKCPAQQRDACDTRLAEESVRKVATWRTARALKATANDALKEPATELRRFGLEAPDCDTLKKPESAKMVDDWTTGLSKDQADIVSASIENMRGVCKELSDTQDVVLPGGKLAAAIRDLDAATSDLERQRAQGVIQRNSYRAALAAYDKAAAEFKRPENGGARDQMKQAAAKAKTAVAALSRLDDAFSAKFLSEQRRESLNAFLSAMADTSSTAPPSKETNIATDIMAVFPDLAAKAERSLADANKPNLTPLLLQKSLEQIKVEAADRDLQAQVAGIALLQQKLGVDERQLERYLSARGALANNKLRSEKMAAALAPATPPTDDQIGLWRATAYYLDAVGRLQADEGKIDFKWRALQRDRALAYAESSVMQWSTLIDSHVAQMAEFGASGIKKDDIVALINSISLLGIAIGTNR
jgi:hypothetical protein